MKRALAIAIIFSTLAGAVLAFAVTFFAMRQPNSRVQSVNTKLVRNNSLKIPTRDSAKKNLEKKSIGTDDLPPYAMEGMQNLYDRQQWMRERLYKDFPELRVPDRNSPEETQRWKDFKTILERCESDEDWLVKQFGSDRYYTWLGGLRGDRDPYFSLDPIGEVFQQRTAWMEESLGKVLEGDSPLHRPSGHTSVDRATYVPSEVFNRIDLLIALDRHVEAKRLIDLAARLLLARLHDPRSSWYVSSLPLFSTFGKFAIQLQEQNATFDSLCKAIRAQVHTTKRRTFSELQTRLRELICLHELQCDHLLIQVRDSSGEELKESLQSAAIRLSAAESTLMSFYYVYSLAKDYAKQDPSLRSWDCPIPLPPTAFKEPGESGYEDRLREVVGEGGRNDLLDRIPFELAWARSFELAMKLRDKEIKRRTALYYLPEVASQIADLEPWVDVRIHYDKIELVPTDETRRRIEQTTPILSVSSGTFYELNGVKRFN